MLDKADQQSDEDVDDANDEESKTTKPCVFISYRWNETKLQVREISDYLKSLNKYDVWIDTEEMYGDKNERMEEGIRKAAIVVIFFSDEYQKSRDCRKEAESADRNGKQIVFVKMQQPKCDIQSWFAPIIGNTIFIDYFKFKNPGEEIVKHVDRLLNAQNQQNQLPTFPTSGNSSSGRPKFITVKVPKFAKYQNRSDEPKICEAIARLCSISDVDKEGALIICGGGGTGKTTLMSQLVHLHSDFLRSTCGISVVMWLNCFKWTGDAFDEGELTRSLIDLAEKAVDHSGFRQLDDIADFFEKQHEKALVILDDVFNVQIIETLRDHCQGIRCVAVTRDVDELTARHGLVSEVYRLQELEDEEIVQMFESAYRLKGKLSRDQFRNLAKLCSGLPIVVSLIAARFQDCETTRDFAAEYELVMEEVKVKDLKIAGPYGTVSKLFQFSIEQLDEDFRKMYYAFLLFDPAEPVDVEDLAILWNCSNPHRALVRCRQFAKKSLARPLVASSNNEAGRNAPVNYKQGGDYFLVHQILHEAAVDSAIKTHRHAESLEELRGEIIVGFSADITNREAVGLELLAKAVINQRRNLLETIFAHVAVPVLASICRKKSEQLTNGKSFVHFLYNTEWPDNGRPSFYGTHHSIRLLRKLFVRMVKFNQLPVNQGSRVDLHGVLSEKDSLGGCLLFQLFSETETWSAYFKKAYRNDRQKLTRFLSPIDGLYIKYRQLDWYHEAQSLGISAILRAAGEGDLDALKTCTSDSPLDVRKKSEHQETPLMAAALMGHVEIVKYLYQLDPSDEHIQQTDVKGKTAFMIACKYGQLEIAKFLYENAPDKAAELQRRDIHNRTPINLAAMNGSTQLVAFLAGINASLLDDVENYGRSALLQASRFGHEGTVRYLITVCKRVHDNETDKAGHTSLCYAAINGHIEITKFLCENAGASINKATNYGCTALMLAAQHGELETVMYLYDKDPKEALGQSCKDGKTALLLAADTKSHDIVLYLSEKYRAFLLSQGQNSTDSFWSTLMVAAKNGRFDVTTALVGDRENWGAMDSAIAKISPERMTEAYHMAVQKGHKKIAAYLKTVVKEEDYIVPKQKAPKIKPPKPSQ